MGCRLQAGGRPVRKAVPDTENPLVLRTDFSDDVAWEAICAAIRQPVGIFRFRADVDFLDDQAYDGASAGDLRALLPNYRHSFIFVVDERAVVEPDHPVLVVDLVEGAEDEFRAVPKQIQSIENNLSLANMDFDEFASAVDGDGVFRGFPGDPFA